MVSQFVVSGKRIKSSSGLSESAASADPGGSTVVEITKL